MTNAMVACVYIPFAIMNMIISIVDSLKYIKRQEINIIIVLYFLVVCWFVSDIAWILTTNENMAKFFKNLVFIFLGFVPPVLLLAIFDFFQISLKRVAKFVPLIFLLPSVNAIMGLTAKHHSLFIKQFDIISFSPIREFTLVWGSWFWVHTAYCYIIMLTIIAVILVRRYRLPRFYRLPSTMMTIGIVFALVTNVIKFLQFFPVAFDPTLICIGVSLILLNFAIINNSESKFVRYSYAKTYDYLDLYILIMDESERVVHANSPAHDWFSSLGITLHSSHINEIMESLLNKGAIQKDSENERGVDIYFPSDPFPLILNIHIQKMSDTNGDIIGSVAIFTDVTQNRLLINKLEEKVGIDSLTGLANHMAYEGAKKRFDDIEHLPLSVVMCDVNRLKHVNDTLGHQYGDMMLRVAAEILESVRPKSGFVARIGGDEFILLLPCTPPESASELMEEIKEQLSSRESLPFTVSMSLGTATKHYAYDNLPDIIALADSRMYEDKQWIKLK